VEEGEGAETVTLTSRLNRSVKCVSLASTHRGVEGHLKKDPTLQYLPPQVAASASSDGSCSTQAEARADGPRRTERHVQMGPGARRGTCRWHVQMGPGARGARDSGEPDGHTDSHIVGHSHGIVRKLANASVGGGHGKIYPEANSGGNSSTRAQCSEHQIADRKNLAACRHI